MPEQDKIKTEDGLEKMDPIPFSRDIVGRLLPLTGSDAINMILDHDSPVQLVQNMSRVDFFWIMKKVGEDDSLPLLTLASLDQWQYILDMQLWLRDRINMEETFSWLDRLSKADPSRLSSWLLSDDGNLLAHFFFFKALRVKIMEDEDFQIPEGFITFDNIYYIKVLDEEHKEEIEQILRNLSQEDFNRFQALLLGLAGVLPSEVEEEMYRFKSVRLAEDGYLPFEEAISVYSHQRADLLKKDESEYKLFLPDDRETKAMVPITPLMHTQGDNLLARSISRVTDNILLDRLRIEFAGLCNQIFSADGARLEDIDVLTRICRKAAGYINLGLVRLSEGSVDISEQFIRNNPLISIFRVGFGMALEIKWEAGRWVKDAWFQRQGLNFGFWGDEWGWLLKGVLEEKPLYFSGLKEEEPYRDFKDLSEVESCRVVLHRLVLLDTLLGAVSSHYPLDKDLLTDPLMSFHPVFFNFWARGKLKLKQGFAPLSLEQVKDFFRLIRGKEKTPPFRMPGFAGIFVTDFMSYVTGLKPDETILLKETLAMIWQKFSEEYALVETADLDARFTKFIQIYPNP
ncbi:DUF6178 family protein [Thermodesulfobacteriota bacterium]